MKLLVSGPMNSRAREEFNTMSSPRVVGYNDAPVDVLYHLTESSSNAKTGPIPVSTSSWSTCPDSCPLKSNGCYVIGPVFFHWREVSNGRRGTTLDVFADAIRKLPRGQLWRHNQAGDLPGENQAIDAAALGKLVAANVGRRGYTYTHKPVLDSQGGAAAANREAIAAANRAGFTINLSANGLKHADKLAALGIAPVTTLCPDEVPENRLTPDGRKVVICPAQTRENVTCASCGLCQKANRTCIVGFLPHGSQKKKALEVARLNS